MNITRPSKQRTLIHHNYARHRIQTLEEEASILRNLRRTTLCSSRRRANTIVRDPIPIPPLLNFTSRGSTVSRQDKKDDEREVEERVNLMVEEVLAFISTDIEGFERER